MWRSIIEELEANGNIGPALPISCYRHQDTKEFVSEPGKLPQIAPDGCYYRFQTNLSSNHFPQEDACDRAIIV